jgi:hypothetical protein
MSAAPEDHLTEEQFAKLGETLQQLFNHVIAQLPALTGTIPAIANDSIDVRTVLSAVAQSSPHKDSDQILKDSSAEYEKLFDGLSLCRDRVK